MTLTSLASELEFLNDLSIDMLLTTENVKSRFNGSAGNLSSNSSMTF